MSTPTPNRDPAGTDVAHDAARRAAQAMSMAIANMAQLRRALQQRQQRRTPLTTDRQQRLRDAERTAQLEHDDPARRAPRPELDSAREQREAEPAQQRTIQQAAHQNMTDPRAEPPADMGHVGDDAGDDDFEDGAGMQDALAGAAAVAAAAGSARRDIDAVAGATDGHDASLADNEAAVRGAQNAAIATASGIRSGRVTPVRASVSVGHLRHATTGQTRQVRTEGEDLVRQRERDLAAGVNHQGGARTAEQEMES